MSDKLNDLSKILLATGAINYMASAIDSVNTEMKFVPDEKGYHKDGIEERTELLTECRSVLYEIMEKLADYMNGADCITPIDVRATNEAFKIVSGGHDNVEEL